MTHTPLISIIMPIYNAMPYLQKAIESVINQTYTNWECILVDNNSRDDSVACAREFCARDKRIQLYFEPQQGAAMARNTALSKVNGEYIAFCDADDILHPQKLEKQWHFLCENKLDAVFSGHDWLVKDIHKPIIHCTDWNYESFQKNRLFPCMATIMVKKSQLDKTQFYRNIQNGEDIELFLCQLPQFATLGFMNDILYHYRMHDNAVSRAGFWNINIFILHYIACHQKNSDDFHFPYSFGDLFRSKNWHLIFWVLKFHFIYFIATPPYIWGRLWRKYL